MHEENQDNLNSDLLSKAKESALVFLSYRDRSISEMNQRLSRKGYPAEVVEIVVRDLEKVDLLNDKRFALSFSRYKVEDKSWGPEKLRFELRIKGIDKELAENVISRIYEKYSQNDLIQKLLSKRLKNRQEANRAEMKKHIDYLKRRGFRWDVIREAISNNEGYFTD
ncbi:MAG: regulatory protein RecX [Candidatus Marinimicrobia bacterium]|nr:regulatory protein RecX [Candidatus Neomarinimicrobiota bacterium]